MPNYSYDQEYLKLVENILNSNEFREIDKIEHHGLTRMDHSIKVSYYAYKIAKMMHLDYKSVARGGLLHDFFMSPENRTLMERFLSTFTHPKIACEHASSIFDVNEKERNIITGHMFPININVPKTSEAWIVNFVDKVVGGQELVSNYKNRLEDTANLYTIFVTYFIMAHIQDNDMKKVGNKQLVMKK